jgi:hypothetical protein
MARLCAATTLSVLMAAYVQQVSIPQILQDARTLLTRAEASSAGSAEQKRALSDAADRLERLAGNGLPATAFSAAARRGSGKANRSIAC